MIVYFDTNVFDHIEKRLGVTERDRNFLKRCVRSRTIEIPLSVFALEEVLPLLETSPALGRRELELILDMTEWRKLLKAPHVLLTDDIRAYARGDVSPGPYLELTPVLRANLRKLKSDPGRFPGIVRVLTQAREQRETFVATMTRVRQRVVARADEARATGGRPPKFKRYFEALAEKFAEGWAERAGVLEQCKDRGMKELLTVPSVRVAVGMTLSYTYAQTIEGRVPRTGDSRDMLHAIVGSAADVLVVQDDELRRMIARIPVDGIEVCSVTEFITSIRSMIPGSK